VTDYIDRPPQKADPYTVLARAFSGDAAAETEAAKLLLKGARTFIETRGVIPLERCCNFPPPTARRAWAKLERDFWLCRAGALIPAEKPWHRAVALAKEISAFQSRVLPAWRDLEAPPPSASELRSCLFFAHRADPDNLPRTPRRLSDILQAGLIATQKGKPDEINT